MQDTINMTRGCQFDYWRNADHITLPGGAPAPLTWTNLADNLVQLSGAIPSMDGVSSRWQRAQQAEAAFWKGWRNNPIYSHTSLTDFWQDVVEKTGGPLAPGLTLDIGCGPVSVLNFTRHQQMTPIGVDPLADLYSQENLVESAPTLEPIPMLAMTAERLPFADETFDQAVCFNVLDHVSNAPRVLDEIRRVLKPGASLRVYVHTFAPFIKRLLFFDTPHVYHWDHNEFASILCDHGFRICHQLKEPKTFDLPSGLIARLAHFPYWVATKVAFTSYFQIVKSAV